MHRIFLTLFVSLILPTSAMAAQVPTAAPASFSAARSLLAASSSPGNAYVAGASVVLTAPVVGDLSAFGGSLIIAAPVSGDDLLLAGSISSRAKVAGDLRAVGGNIDINGNVTGDLIIFGFSVRDSSCTGGSSFIVAANTTLTNGASGPVTIYGNNIALGGDFAGPVTVIATGRLALSPDTVIHGRLSYEAPERALVPDSATVLGGITYTNTSYLPDAGTSRILAALSIGLFLVARLIGALILAGLLAGLFPRFAETLLDRISLRGPRGILLTLSLGFAFVIAAPIVIILLLLTFVGIGLALLLLALYALLLLLAVMYAGIALGGLLARRFTGRTSVLWRDGVIGMLILSLATLVPVVGLPAILLLTLFSAGTLLTIFFHFAFPGTETPGPL